MFIRFKTGQGSEIPALSVGSLIELVCSGELFEIIRLRFLDKRLREL